MKNIIVRNRPNWEIVIHYLRNNPKNHTIILGGTAYAWVDGKLCYMLNRRLGRKEGDDEIRFMEAEDGVNHFFELCESLSDEEIMELVTAIGRK